MILRTLFPHLSRGSYKRFFASRLLSLYGQTFIGAPKLDDLPEQAGDAVRQRIVDTYFNIQADRLPRKRLPNWELGALKAAQLRDEEEKVVSVAAVLIPMVVCTVIVAVGGMVQSSTAGLEKWAQKRKAAAAAEDAREYAERREVLTKEWLAEAQAYSAQQCLDQASELRTRATPEDNDRYAALQTGCANKRQDIRALSAGWSINQCADFARDANEQMKGGGSQTWADQLVFSNCVQFGNELNALIR